MVLLPDPPPPHWRELCSELQRDNDPDKFQALIEELNRLMTEHEKRTPKIA